MLLPREKPFLTGLNSYYLDIEKFVQHLQGEIGTGCLYCKGADQELLVYFDEYEIVRGVTQNNGEHAEISEHIDRVIESLHAKNFQVTIYYLDPDSIFFWAQMPAFKRARETVSSRKVSLPDLIFRLHQKEFSGFIEIDVRGRNDCAVLFFHQGQRRGGSYYWGTGGLSPSDVDYNTLLGMLQKNKGTYSIGYFTSDPTSAGTVIKQQNPDAEEHEATSEKRKKDPPDPVTLEINKAVNEFMEIFIRIVGAKNKTDPLIDLKLKFIDFVYIYPFLDPYSDSCEINEDGKAVFADTISAREVAEGIVDCVWMVVEDKKLHKQFRAGVKKMTCKKNLLEQGIELDR
jgi:hypothetical protein